MAQNIEESRAQLSGNLQIQADELEQLNRIAIALTSEFDLQKLLQMITDAARRVTAAQYAAFFLIPEIDGKNAQQDAHKVIFNLAAISGATPAIEKHFRHLGPVEGIGVLHPVFWEGASIVVDDVLEDKRYVGVPRGHIPVKARDAEQSLLGKAMGEVSIHQAADLAAVAAQPTSDTRGPAEYKRAMIRTLTVRALRKASARALSVGDGSQTGGEITGTCITTSVNGI